MRGSEQNYEYHGLDAYLSEYSKEQERIERRMKTCYSCGCRFDPMEESGIRFTRGILGHYKYIYICEGCVEDLEDVDEEELIDDENS